MLEVKIAEVSKNLLDQLGASVNLTKTASSGLNTYSLISNFLSGGGGLVQALRIGRGALTIDAEKQDGVVRILAEPNIVAISGQSASFLSGGKIFIPVSQDPGTNGGIARITLEEKEFGVGLKFTPTVLDGGRVNLKLVSEVSELSQTGSPFATFGGFTAILPSMTTRRIDTTVQLGDGQSFVVAGLIKNNMTESLNRFPGLGEVPVMGALFRSTEFQTDQTELMFVVTPRLVRPLVGAAMLPTDNHIVPNRGEVLLMGSGEGAAPAPIRASIAEPTPLAPTVPAPVTRPTTAATGTNKQATTGRKVEMPVGTTEAATPAAVRTSTLEASPVPSPAPAPAVRQ
jgi:pilus assembly protein CpaC